jgi:hypothetical protein
MFERYQSFADYVRDYGLERSEGLLLRHLMQVWKVLNQTVPASAKTEAVVEMEEYFRELIRGVDSSLLDEWERLKNPDFVAIELAAKPARPASFDLTRDTAAFRRLVRVGVLGFLQDVAARDWEAARLRLAAPATTVTDETLTLVESRRIEKEFQPYFDARGRFRLDPEGRALKHTHFIATSDARAEAGENLAVAQILADPEASNDWEARFEVLLDCSRRENRVVLQFLTVQLVGT